MIDPSCYFKQPKKTKQRTNSQREKRNKSYFITLLNKSLLANLRK